MNDKLNRIDNSEELQEQFLITMADEMASDEEPARKKWARLKAAYEQHPAVVDDLLMTLCGWTMATLINMTLGEIED